MTCLHDLLYFERFASQIMRKLRSVPQSSIKDGIKIHKYLKFSILQCCVFYVSVCYKNVGLRGCQDCGEMAEPRQTVVEEKILIQQWKNTKIAF